MNLVSLEQLEILMMVAEADDPLQTAWQIRRRWQYILQVAQAARDGQPTDLALPQVVRDCDAYIPRARAIIGTLDEWLAEQTKRHLPDAS